MKVSQDTLNQLKKDRDDINKAIQDAETTEYSITIKANRATLEQIIQFLES